ncbi:hypothetical protein EV130_1042 [Rhizobium azibense]|uniref:Transposase n=1 Tax=Rhizobium azibense TaxID=1136135 RepID=A0A4R3R5N2_9HYPH|nr:hypothetical protein EV130_1042 [Rhizobium azibense]
MIMTERFGLIDRILRTCRLYEFGEPIHQKGLASWPLTRPLTYGLKEAGFVVCRAIRLTPLSPVMGNNTDKHDARGMAHILRSGCYSQVRAHV